MAISKLNSLVANCLDKSNAAIINAGEFSAREAEDLVQALAAEKIVTRVLDGNYLHSKADLMKTLATVFSFPGYFGNNWDALIDCLSNMSWLPAPGYVCILLHGDDFKKADGKTHAMFVQVCQDVADRWNEHGDGVIFKLVHGEKETKAR